MFRKIITAVKIHTNNLENGGKRLLSDVNFYHTIQLKKLR